MIKIYHNPRCSKSRQGLQILEKSGQAFEIIKYLDTPLTHTEITELLAILKINPIDLVRKGEAIWKEQYKGQELSDDLIIKAMTENPILIERPIIIQGKTGIIGRPPENIKSIL